MTNLCFLFPIPFLVGGPEENSSVNEKLFFHKEFSRTLSICILCITGSYPLTSFNSFLGNNWQHLNNSTITKSYGRQYIILFHVTLVSLELQLRGRKLLKKDFFTVYFRIFVYFIINIYVIYLLYYYVIYIFIYTHMYELFTYFFKSKQNIVADYYIF